MSKAKLYREWSKTAQNGQGNDEVYPLHNVEQLRAFWSHMSEEHYLDGAEPDPKWARPEYAISAARNGYLYKPVLKKPAVAGKLDPKTEKDFRELIGLGIECVMPGSARLLAEGGVSIKIARLMSDIDPGHATRPWRGQASGFVVNTCGYYDPEIRTAAVSQGQIEMGGDAFENMAYDAHMVVVHELGHALREIIMCDIKTRSMEQHIRDFNEAYRRDVTRLNGRTAWQGEELGYYLTKEAGGTQDSEEAALDETFAEMFGEKTLSVSWTLQQAFRETSRVMDKIDRSVEAMIQRAPTLGNFLIVPKSSTPPVAFPDRKFGG